MIKLAANAALMTRISFINEIANVCEATGADVVQVAEGVGSTGGSAELPAGRHRLRRQLLPEGLARAQAARGQLGLPLPAPQRGDRGQRAAEAARDRQAAEAPRQPARQDGRAARARLQAEHRRHARGAEPRAGRAAARGGRRGARLGPRRGRRAVLPRRRSAPTRWRRSPARTRPCSSPSGRSSPSSTGRRRRDDAKRAAHRRPQHARPGRDARGRLRLRGHRPRRGLA